MSGVPRVGVAGGGTMGSAIAAAFAAAGAEVWLADDGMERAAAACARAADALVAATRRGHLAEADRAAAQLRIAAAPAVSALPGGCDLLVEAVPERLELKRAVLAAAEALDPALLASNTSSLSIDALAEGLARPERFLGLHFFNPVLAMPLVEVVLGARTDRATRAEAEAQVRRLGKEAIVVRDAPGFASSRLGVALGLEAIRMVEQGVAEPEAIDRAMVLGYRHPMGPLRLTDLVGLDVRLDIARALERVYGERFAPPPLLERMVREGRLGRKTGRGFYAWDA